MVALFAVAAGESAHAEVAGEVEGEEASVGEKEVEGDLVGEVEAILFGALDAEGGDEDRAVEEEGMFDVEVDAFDAGEGLTVGADPGEGEGAEGEDVREGCGEFLEGDFGRGRRCGG